MLALILLAAFVALGRFAAEVYAANPVQRVSVVAMVVAAPFWLWSAVQRRGSASRVLPPHRYAIDAMHRSTSTQGAVQYGIRQSGPGRV